MTLPRPEYPRPQFVRDRWLCLNGEWQFEMDPGDSGLERGRRDAELERRIVVPFCPESALSGIGHVDFMHAVWYRCTVRVPVQWAGQRVLLHFGAVDHDATVWVNGREVVRHRGGWTPFSADITEAARPGDEATIVVRARDPHRAPQALGKQSSRYANYACHYTRTTGIWQTVWLEPVPEVHLRRTRITPDVANGCFHIEQPLSRNATGHRLRAILGDGEGAFETAEVAIDYDLAPRALLGVPEARKRLWEAGAPYLYDLTFELIDDGGQVVDRVQSYAGLRSTAIDGPVWMLNGEPLFQRLVLDQGYYPDGLLTAPSDAALVRDIEIAMAAGFNGARLHQKVFEERFLYHADRLGYLVWGEFGDWGGVHADATEQHNNIDPSFIGQWLEAIDRDYSHPSIVGWCPLNESVDIIGDRISELDVLTRGMFLATKAMDASRPVLDASGHAHRVPEADIYDSHDYDQNPETFKTRHDALLDGRPHVNLGPHERIMSIPWRGQPYFVSEFGGIWWNPEARPDEDSWGYGDRPRSEEEFYARFEGLCNALLANPGMFGYCYTQLTDVFQEQNGVVRFDRSRKLDLERLCRVQQQPAAIEAGRLTVRA